MKGCQCAAAPYQPRRPIPREYFVYKGRHLVALLLDPVTRVVLRPAAVTTEARLAAGAASATLQTKGLLRPRAVVVTAATKAALTTRAGALNVIACGVGARHRLLYVARRFLQYEKLNTPLSCWVCMSLGGGAVGLFRES